MCFAKAMCLKTREVGKENSPVQFNNIEKEWMESSIINCVTKVIVLLSFNSALPSLGVYTTAACYRMIFDGFLTLKSCTYICTYVCVSVCGGEFTYPGNTRDWL